MSGVLRSRLMVEAPARWSQLGGTSVWSYAQRWEVCVEQHEQVSGTSFTVQGRLLHEERSDGAPTPQGVLVPAAGPHRFRSLAAARKDARRLAEVLSGQLYPQWDEEHYPVERAGGDEVVGD